MVNLNTCKTVRLENICDVLSGFAFDSKQFTDKPNNTPIIRIRDIKRGFTTTYYAGEYDKRYIVESGDFLIGMDGEFNIGEWKGGSALLNQRVCKLFCKEDKLWHKYAYYFLPKALKQIEEKTPFVTVKHLSVKDIKNIGIPLPPIETQKQIAAILDKASELIELRKQQLAKMDLLIKSKFIAMFGDSVTNPMGWEQEKLECICHKITDGKHGDCQDEANSGYYFISAKDIENGKISYEHARQITKSDYKETNKRTKLLEEDILVVNTGATIGKVAIATKSDVDKHTVFQKSVAIITVDKKQIMPMFLCQYIKLNREQIYDDASGSAQKNWLLSQMRSYKILVPPIALQNEFAAFVDKVEQQKAVMQASLAKLEINYKALMQKYFG